MDNIERTYFIAITGMSGSGKTTVGNFLREKGCYVFDTDAFTREILKKDTIIVKIIENIVKETITKDGEIDYKKIGKIFDSNPKLENRFETWFQTYIGNKILEKSKDLQDKNTMIFFDIPLLKQKGILEIFDMLWIIETNAEVCYNRIRQRNGYSDQKIQYILTNSKLYKEYYQYNCIIINNNSSIENLKKIVDFRLNCLIDKLYFNS